MGIPAPDRTDDASIALETVASLRNRAQAQAASVAQLRQWAEDIAALRSLDPLQAGERFAAIIAEARTLREASTQLGLSFGVDPSWEDGAGYERFLAQVEDSIRRQQSRGAREELGHLAGVVARLRLQLRLPSRMTAVERLRQQATTELEEAAALPCPPRLPGEGRGRAWLEAAYAWTGEEGQESHARLQALSLPALSQLLELNLGIDVCLEDEASAAPRQGSTGGPSPSALVDVFEAPAGVVEARPADSPSKSVATIEQPTPASAAEVGSGTSPGAELPAAEPIAHAEAGAAAGEDAEAEPTDPPVADQPLVEPVATSDRRVEPAPAPIIVPPAEPPAPKAAARVVESAAPVPVTAVDLPIPQFDYAQFREAHRVSPEGTCEPAPWLQPDFDLRLAKAAERELAAQNLGRLWILCTAQAFRGNAPLIEPEDIESLAQLWHRPLSSLAGDRRGRVERFRHCMAESPAAPGSLVLCLLEGVRPDRENQIFGGEAATLATQLVPHEADLKRVLGELLISQGRGIDALAILRSQIRAGPLVTPAEIERRLQVRRDDLQKGVRDAKTLPGRLRTTHCRAAWTAFIDQHVNRLAHDLGPKGMTSVQLRDGVTELEAQVRRLPDRHEEIADRSGAKYEDRNAMDRVVAEIAEQAMRVLDLARELASARAPAPPSHLMAEIERMKGAKYGEPTEELLRQLLVRLATASDSPFPDPLVLGLADLATRPHLAPFVLARQERELGSEGISASIIEDPLRCAAALVDPPMAVGEEGELAGLRNAVREGQRDHLLRYFVGRSFEGVRMLNPLEEARAHSRRDELLEALRAQIDQLRRLWRDVDDLGFSIAPRVRELVETASAKLENDAEPGWRDTPLVREWLRQVTAYLERSIKAKCEEIRQQAQTAGESVVEDVETALAERRFSDAYASALGQSAFTKDRDLARQTAWRDKAAAAPAGFPKTLPKGASSEEEAKLTTLWRAGLRPEERNDLRKSFYRFISNEQKNPRTDLRDFSSSHVRIRCLALVEFLREERLNPTFVPQLRRIGDIFILSPPSEVHYSVQAFAQKLAQSASNEGKGGLAIYLAPGLDRARRDEALREIRSRSLVNAALIDDTDLHRLLAPGSRRPHGFLGLIEIALEQLDWTRYSPFEIRDGQFIQPEMFVGRDVQVNDLVTTPKYSRIFSGRRLGKSALLKYLELSRDQEILPSGNRLRVLYIMIAGADSEHGLVGRIFDQMQLRLNFAAPTGGLPPGDALAAHLARFLAEHPKDSLLIILDEADQFVGDQLRLFEKLRERCLSYRMMKEMSGQTDSANLPRVRFVFSGYRLTNTRGGTWANAGDTLQLEALHPEEAERLIEVPLARIGVNAKAQTPAIARRCGFQPAVLLRFGECLLTRLAQIHPKNTRGLVTVTDEDVSHVFNDAAVQDEIRTLVTNNFQGNPAGEVVFFSFLLCLCELPPGTLVADAPERILRQIQALDSDTGWLREIESRQIGEIERHLRDFVARGLVLAEDRGFRLRFPHYLPVLVHPAMDLSGRIRQGIQALRSSASETLVSSLMAPSDLDQLRDLRSRANSEEEPVLCSVVGAAWMEGIQNDRGGIPDRLGLSRGEVTDFSNNPAITDPGGLLAIHADSADLDQMLTLPPSRGTAPILIGGLDLLRRAIESDRSVDRGYILSFGLDRLSLPRLHWWFERLRAWTFQSPDSIQQIYVETSGIPFLVGEFDQILLKEVEPAGEVTTAQLRHARAELERRLPELAQRLREGPPAERLTPRELELLRMVDMVGLLSASFSWDDELGTSWEREYAADLALPAYGTSEEDRTARDLLTRAGFVSMDSNHGVHLVAQDKLHALVRHLPAL